MALSFRKLGKCTDRRTQMTFGRRELIEHCHSQAVRSGMDRPIVLVGDLANGARLADAVSLLGEKIVRLSSVL